MAETPYCFFGLTLTGPPGGGLGSPFPSQLLQLLHCRLIWVLLGISIRIPPWCLPLEVFWAGLHGRRPPRVDRELAVMITYPIWPGEHIRIALQGRGMSGIPCSALCHCDLTSDKRWWKWKWMDIEACRELICSKWMWWSACSSLKFKFELRISSAKHTAANPFLLHNDLFHCSLGFWGTLGLLTGTSSSWVVLGCIHLHYSVKQSQKYIWLKTKNTQQTP